ncbi:MAG: hypothetical protein JWM88_3190 [Verrucomicrobia bacterium]|nr:hypothetical protein [Verrucomicrobiota bacterium]
MIEVIIAIGITAASVTAMLTLMAAQGRSAAEIHARTMAANLGVALAIELERLRDSALGVDGDKLDSLAALVPVNTSADAFRLVGALDGTRVTRESDAGDPDLRIPLADQFFLIEVRRLPGGMAYVKSDGFLAMTATIRWPYQIRTGPGPVDAVGGDLVRGSRLVLNLAVGP